MPQATQHSLIHILLFWTTILSIFQVVLIILLFTGGHHGPLQFQNNSNEALGGSMQLQGDSPTSSTSENRLHLGSMVTYMAIEVKNKTVTWKAVSMNSELISEEGYNLTLKKDGYYFLTLQVKLSTCEKISSTLTVKLAFETKVLLQGTINTNTCSTGLLGKVQGLSAGGNITVTFDSDPTTLDCSEYLTHLDVIYLRKP